MKERPILMSAPMVRAILAGAKTQTRRIVKPQQPKPSTMTPYELELTVRDGSITAYTREQFAARCPYGVPGDRLWVREAWQPIWADGVERPPGYDEPEKWAVRFPATDGVIEYSHPDRGLTTACKPGIHLPRSLARITLEVTRVRVERLHDITEEDARAEGVEPYTPPHGCISPDQRVPGPGFDRARLGDQPHRLPFADLWEKINGAESWAANPWVWVVEFRPVVDEHEVG